MKDELKRMNKGFMRKDGKFFLPITHESLVVDSDGVSINKKYLSADGLAGYATEQYVKDAILNAQLDGAEVDLSNYATLEMLDEKANKSDIPFVDVNKSYVDEQIEGHTHDEYATEQFVEDKLAEIDLSTSHVHENKTVLDAISLTDIDRWDSKSDFSGSYNDLADKPDFEGFASKEYVEDAIKAVEVAPGIHGPQGEAGPVGPQGPAGADGITPIKGVDYFTEEDIAALNIPAQPNYQYQIEMIDATEQPSVEIKGVYPDLVVVLKIPFGVAPVVPDEPEPEAGGSKMWIGWIPFDHEAYENGEEPNIGFTDPSHVDANMTMDIIQLGLQAGTLQQIPVQELVKYEVGVSPSEAFIYTKSANYKVTIDDGIGGKIFFIEENWSVPQNGTELINPIDDVVYCISGGMAYIERTTFFYVDSI